MFPHGETVTVLRRVDGGTDRYGNPSPTWAEGVDVALCAVAPRASDEPSDTGRTAVITGLTVYMPTGTVIGPGDRLVVRGVTYEVEGEPGDWRSPFSGWHAGVEVAVSRAEG